MRSKSGINLFIVLALLVLTAQACFGQHTKRSAHAQLAASLDTLFHQFHGVAGMYVENLKTGETLAIQADTLFPTASMVKTTIECGLLDKVEKGLLKYHQNLVYRDSLLYKGVDILGSFKNGDTIELSKVNMLMLTMSDNTASLWLQKLVGTDYINAWMGANGFKETRDNSQATGRDAYHKAYGWGTTTPREISTLIKRIWEGKVVSPAASERIYRNLSRSYWDDVALSEIPPFVATASKQGAVDQSRSEVVLVSAPHGSYVFSVITKNAVDERWTHDNESEVLIRHVSALLWRYYEPTSKWKPANGMVRFQE